MLVMTIIEKKFHGRIAHKRKYAKPVRPLFTPAGASALKMTPNTNP